MRSYNTTNRPKATAVCQCPQCQSEFIRTSKHPQKRFCSLACALQWRSTQADIARTKPCEYCCREFVPPVSKGHQRYCSRSCSSKATKPKKDYGTEVCQYCGDVFVKNFADRKFCSMSCSGMSNTYKREFITPEKYFLDRTQQTDTCWLWIGKKGPKNYGIAVYRGRSMLAHRFSYELHYGSLSMDGMNVLHRCDNPKCVRPDHLFLGTQQDNIDDMHKKQRHAHGERMHNAKLTDDDVRTIRTSPKTGADLAREFGVTSGTISSIKHRLSWRHVD